MSFVFTQSKKLLIASITFGIIAGILSSLVVVLIHRQLKTSLEPSVSLFLFFLFIGICYAIFNTINQHLLIRLSYQSIHGLRCAISKQILNLPIRSYELLGSHRIYTTLTSDLNTIANTIEYLPSAIVNVTIVLGCLTYMFILSWQLSVFVVVFISIGFLFVQLPFWLSKAPIREAREQENLLFKSIRTMGEGIKNLHIHHPRKEAFFSQELKQRSEVIATKVIRGKTLQTIGDRWGEFIVFTCIFCLISLNIFVSDLNIVLGVALACMYMAPPLITFINFIPRILNATIALDHIESLGFNYCKSDIELEKELQPLPVKSQNSIKMENITYTYESTLDHPFEFGPFSATFNSSEVAFIVGGNGTGKTTLLKILCGLYDRNSGQIHWNDNTIIASNLIPYRQLFSVVFSDFFLFDSLLGLDNIQHPQTIDEYLRLLELDTKITIKKGQFSTVDLSQGQRKRLALLVSYLEDRPVYVFDEWASDQDPLFKDVFYNVLLPQLKLRNKIVIAITHDDRYFHLADQVIKLERRHAMSLVPTAG